MKQLTFFGRIRPADARPTDPQTSWDAARSLTDEDISDTQREILEVFAVIGPMTDEELIEMAETMGMRRSPSGIRTRRNELVETGIVEDTGQRRPTRSGRQAVVWDLKRHRQTGVDTWSG